MCLNFFVRGEAAMDHVSEWKEQGGFGAIKWGHGVVEHQAERAQVVKGVKYEVDFYGISVVFDFKVDVVFNGLGWVH